jgi:LPXTG-site transpeptidase (sortase) family protein
MGPEERVRKRLLVGACFLVAAALSVVLWRDAWVGADDPGAHRTVSRAQPKYSPGPKPQKVVAARHPLQRETQPPPSPVPTTTPSAPATGSAVLRIPTLGVAAPVQTLPVTNTRTLDPPSDYTTVGLWPLGSQPGDALGTSIIAGHTVHTGGGALDDLEQVSPGDAVTLERPGADLGYQVVSVKVYGKATLAQDTAAIFSQSVPGRLAVVTCEDWNGSVYLSNVVVIAEPA